MHKCMKYKCSINNECEQCSVQCRQHLLGKHGAVPSRRASFLSAFRVKPEREGGVWSWGVFPNVTVAIETLPGHSMSMSDMLVSLGIWLTVAEEEIWSTVKWGFIFEAGFG